MSDARQSGPIFVGGAGRSGTTLMRVLLDAHPRICCGPELKVLPQISQLYELVAKLGPRIEAYGNSAEDVRDCFRQLIDGLTGRYRAASGKPRWAEKTPHNVLCMATLGTIFPDARFIHMVRDGRDVVCSLVTMDWFDPLTGQKLAYIQNVTNATRYWRDIILQAHRQAQQPVLAGRVIQVPYEMLVGDIQGTMTRVLEFVGEAWDAAILEAHKKDRSHEPMESSTEQVTRPIYSTAIGRWKRDMTPTDKAAFKAEAGTLLHDLGYEAGQAW